MLKITVDFRMFSFVLCVSLSLEAFSASTSSSRIAELASKRNKQSSFSGPVTMRDY